jgi:hypothetical protein
MRTPLCTVLLALEREAIHEHRRDLLPEIELSYWRLDHVCDELDLRTTDRHAELKASRLGHD